jgi:hypothetical protein
VNDENRHEDLGPDADLGPGRDVLRQTIGALVDGATPPGVPSAPEENLGLLRRRVRTWRIAKAGAAGLTTAVVVSALAFSAAQASTWTRSEPLPGRPTVQSTERGPVPSEVPTTRTSPSPTVSASPSPSVTPSPSNTPRVEPTPEVSASSVVVEPEPGGSATAEPEAPEVVWPPFEPFDEGYFPWAFDASPIACGLPIGDLPTDPVRFTIEPNDSPSDRRVTSGFTVTEVAGEPYELDSGAAPELLLFQEGRLVSSSSGARDAGTWGSESGSGEFTADGQEIVAPGQTWQLAQTYTMTIEDVSTCGDRTDNRDWPAPEFHTPLPAGEYEVVYAAPYQTAGSDSWEIAFSDPYPVTLP